MSDTIYVRIEPEPKHHGHASSTRRRIVGAVSLLGLITAWVAQAEVSQYIQTGASYNKPMLMVWWNHSFMALLLPIQSLIHMMTRRTPDDGNIHVLLYDVINTARLIQYNHIIK
jgi:hypothetical protein